MFSEADARGWSVVAPHHELSAGFMAEAASRMTGKPACASARWAGHGQYRRGDSVRPRRELAGDLPRRSAGRITERRVRRGRIQFVRQEPLFAASVKYSSSIEYADQTDEIIHEAIRRAMSGTRVRPMSSSVARDPRGARCRRGAEPVKLPAGQPGRRYRELAEP